MLTDDQHVEVMKRMQDEAAALYEEVPDLEERAEQGWRIGYGFAALEDRARATWLRAEAQALLRAVNYLRDYAWEDDR